MCFNLLKVGNHLGSNEDKILNFITFINRSLWHYVVLFYSKSNGIFHNFKWPLIEIRSLIRTSLVSFVRNHFSIARCVDALYFFLFCIQLHFLFFLFCIQLNFCLLHFFWPFLKVCWLAIKHQFRSLVKKNGENFFPFRIQWFLCTFYEHYWKFVHWEELHSFCSFIIIFLIDHCDIV